MGRVRVAILLFLGTEADMTQALVILKCVCRASLHDPTKTVHLSHVNRLLQTHEHTSLQHHKPYELPP